MRATFKAPRRLAYSKPGGPWDVAALDDALRPHDVLDGRGLLPAALLEESVARVAGGLWEAGIRRRAVVSWQRANDRDALVLFRACWRIGAVAAPIHHLAGSAEVEWLVDRLRPRLFVDALPEGAPVRRGGGIPSGELAVALATSGSSGEPKIVLHSHRGLSYKAASMARVHGLGAGDAVLMPAPLAHISGLLNGVLLPGAVPMKVVLMAKWDPALALDIIESERITFMIGPPTFFVALMSSPLFTAAKVESLRLVSCGGAGVTEAFAASASEALGCVVKRTYGSTEAPTVTTSAAGDPTEKGHSTDGRRVGEVEVRIYDLPSGRPLLRGDVGEVRLRGPELFAGYADEGQTRAAFSRGWFRTGDLGVVDNDGYLTIVGRLSDVIIRGGENIAAAEVEGLLEAHPDIRQAVVVGRPDDRLGERVAAYVVASVPFDVAACRAWFEERGVARFKTPEWIVRVDELPLMASGKPDRAALRARA